MPVIIFLIMNAIVVVSSFLVTYKLFRIPNFIDSLICWFILYLTQIVFAELTLGVLGILWLRNIILLNLSVLLLIYLITKDQAPLLNLGALKDNIPAFLENKAVLLGISVILCFGLVKIFINLINPPFGWDSLNYHFTFPVEWLKHGNLDTPITVSDDPSPSYYPINGSLFFLWLIMPLKSVFLADLGQAPFFILSFLAAYGISRKSGLDREFSFYAAVLFLLIPNFFKQLQIAYVDMAVAALFLACLNYLFLLNKEFSGKNVLVYSMSLGLLIGTKTVALPYSVLLFLPFVYIFLKEAKKPCLFIASIVIITALGGYSYIRNFMETQNPLYPLNLKFLGQTVFKGVIDAHIYRSHFTAADYRLSKLLFHEGLGLQATVFILPAVFLALPVALVKKNKNFTLITGYFLILPLLIYLVYRFIIPLANTRYLYSLLGIGVILGFYVSMLLNIPKRIINISVVICILASMPELAKRQELVISTVLTALLFIFSGHLIRYFKRKPLLIKKSLLAPSFLILIAALLIPLERDYKKNEYSRYIKMIRYSGFWPDAAEAWNWLNKNTRGNNIAYIGRPVPFPLYGSGFKNNVYYASVNKIDPAKLHYFPESHYQWGDDFLGLHKSLEAKGNYRWGADYSVWLSNLSRRETDYLFIYSLHQTRDIHFPLEDGWIQSRPASFLPVFSNETIHIYKILK